MLPTVFAPRTNGMPHMASGHASPSGSSPSSVPACLVSTKTRDNLGSCLPHPPAAGSSWDGRRRRPASYLTGLPMPPPFQMGPRNQRCRYKSGVLPHEHLALQQAPSRCIRDQRVWIYVQSTSRLLPHPRPLFQSIGMLNRIMSAPLQCEGPRRRGSVSWSASAAVVPRSLRPLLSGKPLLVSYEPLFRVSAGEMNQRPASWTDQRLGLLITNRSLTGSRTYGLGASEEVWLSRYVRLTCQWLVHASRRHVISCHRKLSEHHRHELAWITQNRH